ncbi:hypothetical protein [Novosphingobium panipatense]|uniref:Uncharacterized protein n=1 Tax=Novosphingobium panipatense TaxID=428991 RepID=A0ABY1Q5F7_9SPHN|nr:hypothetical protein [Novosphingobium panipatense]SMP58442.1 hypothetical protein SAMN06296065_102473 [Novosphingobium panipatense]
MTKSTIASIAFDHALPIRQPADRASGPSWDSVRDAGVVTLENGKSYRFLCQLTHYLPWSEGGEQRYEVELRSSRGKVILLQHLAALRKELLGRFKARIEQADRDFDQEEAAATISLGGSEAAENEPEADLKIAGCDPDGADACISTLTAPFAGLWAEHLGITPEELLRRLKADEVLRSSSRLICQAQAPEQATDDNPEAALIRILAREAHESFERERLVSNAKAALRRLKPSN